MSLIAGATSALHRVFCLFPQRKRVVFLSRQAERPFDFTLLEPALRKRLPGYEFSWCCVSSIGRMSVPLMIGQLWNVATAELCLVDGYVPAVSLPRRHRGKVVQVWHAPGAIKRFGYQSLDTPAGRSSRTATSLRMHRGYDLVIAGMPGAVSSFAEAFDFPAEKILALGLPRIDYLCSPDFAELRAQRFARAEGRLRPAGANAADAAEANVASEPPAAPALARPVVLYAPTFRKANQDERWLEHAVGELRRALAGTGATLIVAGHPLEGSHEGLEGPGASVVMAHGAPTIDLLHLADYVVTDYSTVAFEAGFAGRRVLFYVPDIEEYRASPGLNVDPLAELPTISFTDAEGVARVVGGARPYDEGAFRTFMDSHAQGVGDGSIQRIVSALLALLEQGGAEAGEDA